MMNLFQDDNIPREYCTVHKVAAFLNVTPRYVQMLAKRGVIPRARKGEYDLLACVHGYLNYFKQMINFYVTRNEWPAPSFSEHYRPPHKNYVYRKAPEKLLKAEVNSVFESFINTDFSQYKSPDT